MKIVIISGIITVALGLIVITVGWLQGIKRIKKDKTFLPADGEIIGFSERTAKIKYNFFFTVAKATEYSPIFRYRTEDGKTIESACLPFTLKISPSYKEYEMYYKTGERTEIKYDPNCPETHFYKPRTGQFIREACYKTFFGLLLIGLGTLMLMCLMV